ncbi:MAG: NADH-quinone oxidoreductase subunit A [Candidatus Lightella neohaematopini]|nr:NADH-quinone oxidoreductase subunit A [Candidatus Lightella neohaematopini]MCV2528664.1 NADH-quinone oxidoreductase subunit A [Candidatus Lightella neohaematopini]
MLHIYIINNFFYLFITLVIISLILCFIILFIKFLLKNYLQFIDTKNKNIPFESGINPIGLSRSYVSNKFYLISIIFTLFDTECIYLYIWSINAINLGWNIFFCMILFMITILVSLFYIIHNNVFEFDK